MSRCVPFTPAADKTGIDHIDDVFVLAPDRCQLFDMSQNDVFRGVVTVTGFCARMRSPVIGDSQIHFNAVFPGLIKTPLYGLQKFFRKRFVPEIIR